MSPEKNNRLSLPPIEQVIAERLSPFDAAVFRRLHESRRESTEGPGQNPNEVVFNPAGLISNLNEVEALPLEQRKLLASPEFFPLILSRISRAYENVGQQTKVAIVQKQPFRMSFIFDKETKIPTEKATESLPFVEQSMPPCPLEEILADQTLTNNLAAKKLASLLGVEVSDARDTIDQAITQGVVEVDFSSSIKSIRSTKEGSSIPNAPGVKQDSRSGLSHAQKRRKLRNQARLLQIEIAKEKGLAELPLSPTQIRRQQRKKQNFKKNNMKK